MKEALKLALESMKRIDAWLIQRGYTGLMPQEKEVITVVEAALAQPEQGPVAWWNDTGTHIDLNVSGRGIPLYTTPPQGNT